MMFNMAKELVREAEKLDGAKKSELYPMAVDALNKINTQHNGIESFELKVARLKRLHI